MKKTAFYLLLLASLIFVGCTNSQKKNEDSGAANTNVEENASIDRPLKIAYVRLDSVLNNYNGYKEMSKKLEAKASANQNLLSSKEQNLQREMNAFNQKLQSGGFVNELAAQQEYEKIQKKGLLAQQQASQIADTFLKEQQHYNDSLNNIILKEVEKYNQKLQSGGFVNELAAQQEYEKIQKKGLLAQQQASQIADTFLKEQQHYNDSLNNIILKEVEKYNQDKGYDLILNTVQMSGVIYGKPELDITNEIIERLNASYSSSKK